MMIFRMVCLILLKFKNLSMLIEVFYEFSLFIILILLCYEEEGLFRIFIQIVLVRVLSIILVIFLGP